ncbi:MAG: O-antigen ligase family protein [Pyrinomonadaceae bacterium]
MIQAEKEGLVPAREAEAELARTDLRKPLRLRLAGLLDSVIFYSLLAVIALTVVPYGTVEQWWESLFECAVLTLGALWMIEGMLSGRWRLSGRGLLAPLAALILFASIQSWRGLSVSPYDTRLFTFKLIGITLTGALLFRYTSSRYRLRALIYLVIGVGVASALFGILRQTTQRDAPGFFLPFLEPNSGYGQFINRNHFAFLMEMALGLALGMVVGGGERRERSLIYLAAALPIWTALVLSNSRGGIFSMLSQLIFLALLFSIMRPPREMMEKGSGALLWLKRKSNSTPVRAALIALLVLAMIAGVLWMGGDPLARRLESMQGEVSASVEDGRESAIRMQIWNSTGRVIKDHWLAGAGFGAYWVAISQYYDASGRLKPYQAHNDYLEVVANGGIIGAALALWFIVEFILRARERLQRSKDPFRRTACLAALAGLFGVAVHSMVDFGLQITANALVCMVLIVIATADERVEEKPTPNISVLKRRS